MLWTLELGLICVSVSQQTASTAGSVFDDVQIFTLQIMTGFFSAETIVVDNFNLYDQTENLSSDDCTHLLKDEQKRLHSVI